MMDFCDVEEESPSPGPDEGTKNPEETAAEALEAIMNLIREVENEELRERATKKLVWATKLVKDAEMAKLRAESDIADLKAAVKAAEEAKPTVEKDIAEIKAMLISTQPTSTAAPGRTYAQATAAHLTQAQNISYQITRKEQMEKQRQHREKTEVAVTLRTADPGFIRDME